MIREHRFRDAEEAGEALAAAVAERLAARLGRPGNASLAVSGGSTPRPCFAALRRRSLPWERVWITLADERFVPAGHRDSNEGLVRRELLVEAAAAASFVGLGPDGAPSPAEAATDAERRLHGMVPFDVAVLGMGVDGHTASLFPGAQGLARALDLSSGRICQAVDPPRAEHRRLTLTAPALVGAGFLALHLQGEEKWRVFETARREGPVTELPVRALLRWARAGVDVYWSP